jgi:ABC-type branched-subunit amino acid transport system substrate-binding protein
MRRQVLVGLVVIMLVVSGCDRPATRRDDPVVKIGLVAPFEGRHRDVGYDVIYSARLAIRQANEASQAGMTKVTLVAVDDFGDPQAARETARAMVIDHDVMAVIGHWLPETTAAAQAVYRDDGMPFVAAGDGLLGAGDPLGLDDGFLRAYEDVTPFDESAGPFAGSAYDGVRLILAAMKEIEASGQPISRANLDEKLATFTFEGVTGTVRVE